jgi:endonuclease/exonuclease/phosphatase family metal-dependent hydrolase
MTPVPDPVPAPADRRIVTYNILYEGANPDHPWEQRRGRVVDELERLSPDILALQEVWLNQLTALRSSLSGFSWVTVEDPQQHTPIAYREAAFDLETWGSFWLVPPESEPGVPGWDAAYQRLVTHATLRDRQEEVLLTVVSLHLDHEGARARREGIALVRDRLGDFPGDVAVVAGDFNCPPGSPAHDRATADREDARQFRDAAAVADSREGPAESYTGFGPSDAPANIDHLLVSDGLAVERAVTCVPPSESTRPPSDHRPVFADIRY